jgi:phenylacetate-CoA ligase
VSQTNRTDDAHKRSMFNPAVQMLSREQLAQLQLTRLLRQLARAYSESPFYRRLLAKAGVDPTAIRSLDDYFQRVPMIEKQDLLADQELHPPFGSRAQGFGPLRQVFFTSGTSGAAQEAHPINDEDLESTGTSMAYTWNMAGIRSGDRVFLTLPLGITGAGSYIYQACAAYGTIPFISGPVDTERKIELIRRTQPEVLIVSPSYLYRLKMAAESAGLEPRRDNPNLRIILLSSEAFSPQWAAGMTEFWNASLHEFYGSTQMGGNTMATCGPGVLRLPDVATRGVLHNLDHRNLIEVRDPETGQLTEPGDFGEVIVTNLYRRKFACIRFRMHDKIRYLGVADCKCGQAFSAYESGTIGRYDDMIKIKGMNVWPDAVDSILFADSKIEEYRATVSSSAVSGTETVTIEVEAPPATAFDESWAAQITTKIRQDIGISTTLVQVPQGTLPRFEAKPRRWHDQRSSNR